MTNKRDLIRSLRFLTMNAAVKRLNAYLRSRPPIHHKMIGWYGIRSGQPLLFTQSQEQADSWERVGILVTGALIKDTPEVQAHAGKKTA